MAPPQEAPSGHVLFHGEKTTYFHDFEDSDPQDQSRRVLKRVSKEKMDSRSKVAEIVDICKRLESEIRPQSENAGSTKPSRKIEGPRRQNLKRAARGLALTKMDEKKNAEVSDCIANFMKEFDIDESRNYLEQFGLVLKKVENEANCSIVHDGI